MTRFFVKLLAVLGGIALLVAGGLWGIGAYISSRLHPDPVTIASASLQGIREQNRLSAFAARYVAVVTSKQAVAGLSAQKTLIMPGMVRYEVDLAKLQQRDVRWNAGKNLLSVTLPPVEVSAPQIDMTQLREYGSGGLLATFTNADAELDAANRRAGQAELVRQAHEAFPMRLARDATRRAVERSFAMPLRAAGIAADVTVRFADEGQPSSEAVDGSTPLSEIYNQR